MAMTENMQSTLVKLGDDDQQNKVRFLRVGAGASSGLGSSTS